MSEHRQPAFAVNRDTAPWPMFFPIGGNSPPLPKPSLNPPWECPRCGTVNAWWVARCNCKPGAKP